MRFGCCCDIGDALVAYAAGFDYIECKVTSLLPEEDDDAVESVLAQHQASPLPISAFNVFLPRDLKIVGPQVDSARIGSYVETALKRVHQIGAEIIVFGSGAARSIPEGFPTQQAQTQTIDFLHRVADTADSYGLVVVIEPLNRKETNAILSVAEGVALARIVNRPSIQVLADFYHMDEEQEPLVHLTDFQDWIKHIHVADTGRLAPGTGQYPYGEFAERLYKAGYEGMVSVECRWLDFAAEARPAADFLRRVFQ